MTMNAEEVLKVMDDGVAILSRIGDDPIAPAVNYWLSRMHDLRTSVEQMAKDAERYRLLCQHVDASIAYARRLYLHYHVAGDDAVAEDFSRLTRSLESGRTVATMQESAK